MKHTQKIAKAIGKRFQQTLITATLMASWNNHLLTIVLNNVYEIKDNYE